MPRGKGSEYADGKTAKDAEKERGAAALSEPEYLFGRERADPADEILRTKRVQPLRDNQKGEKSGSDARGEKIKRRTSAGNGRVKCQEEKKKQKNGKEERKIRATEKSFFHSISLPRAA